MCVYNTHSPGADYLTYIHDIIALKSNPYVSFPPLPPPPFKVYLALGCLIFASNPCLLNLRHICHSPLFPPLLHQFFPIFVHHLHLSLVSDLSAGLGMSSVKMEHDLDCQPKKSHVDVCWPFMAKLGFYGRSLAEGLSLIVVMTYCRIQISVTAC